MGENFPTFYTHGLLPHLHFGALEIPTYFFINSLVTCLCILWIYFRAEKYDLSQKAVLDVSLIALVAGFAGARLLHVLYDRPTYYIAHPIEIFYVWQGGFVFFGGLISGYLASLLYLRRFETHLWQWHDLFAPVIALGYGLGRLACLAAGCCYGKVCTYPWAIPMVQTDLRTEVTTTIMRHPTPLYAFAWEMAVLVLLLFLENFRSLRSGVLFFTWLGLHGLGRILMEIFREDYRGPQWGAFSISMVLSLLFVAGSLYMVFFHLRRAQDSWFSR